MPETSGNKRRDYSKFDGMSTEMLEDILRADSQMPDSDNSDTDAILYIMEVIAKREKENTTGKFTDVDDAWASFSENYLPYIENDKSLYDFEDTEESGIKQAPSIQPSRPLRKRRLMRVACVAAAVTVLLLASTITASAFGFDLWGAVAKWTMDTFGFSSTSSIKIDDSNQESSSITNSSLQNTLSHYGITADLIPTWFPDGYVLEDVDVAETPTRTTFLATFINSDQEILVTIVSLSVPSTRTYEKDGLDVTVYTANGIEHYIMTNLDHANVVWKTETFECSISGTLTLNEAEKMIESIYERKK